jgi:hypothetical protein
MIIKILALLTIGMLGSSLAQTNDAVPSNSPKITYIGDYKQNPKTDLQLVETIYKEYKKMGSGERGKLDAYRHQVFPGHGNWTKMTDGSHPAIKAEYPDGVNIVTKDGNYIIIWEKDPQQAKAFGLSKE